MHGQQNIKFCILYLYVSYDVFVIYNFYNTSLKMATKGGRNM
jgi:hypothetical protein